VRLFGLGPVQLGAGAELFLGDLSDEAISTTRLTTPVEHIAMARPKDTLQRRDVDGA